MMIEKRHPTGRDFQETEFQSGKFFRNLTGNQIPKSDDRRQVRCREGAVQFEIEKVEEMTATLAGMHADRQAALFRLGIDRHEVRMVQRERADDAAEE